MRGGEHPACCHPAKGGLTPLIKEADSLQLRAAEACWHASEAEGAFKALSMRSWKDNEEAAKVRREQDELL